MNDYVVERCVKGGHTASLFKLLNLLKKLDLQFKYNDIVRAVIAHQIRHLGEVVGDIGKILK